MVYFNILHNPVVKTTRIINVVEMLMFLGKRNFLRTMQSFQNSYDFPRCHRGVVSSLFLPQRNPKKKKEEEKYIV